MSWRHGPGWLLGLALAAGAGPSAASVSMGLNLYGSYTDNLFQNYSRRPDWITLAYVDLDCAPSTALDLYYMGNANVLAEYEELSSHNHQAGLEYTWAGLQGSQAYAGGDLALRLDRRAYRYQDYLQGQVHAGAKLYLGPVLLSRAGYQLRFREYLHAASYSFAEQVLSAQLSRSLESRTTLQAQSELGLKTYARQAEGGGARSLAQAVLRLRVAQSLAAHAGLQVEYLRRIELAGRSRYVSGAVYDADEELFGDRYSYAGSELRAGVKYLGDGVRAETNGQYGQRSYQDRPALDLEGLALGPARQDRRKTFRAELERTFPLASDRLQEVRLHLEWMYLDVDSNDPYYRGATRVYSAGVQVGL